MRLREKLKAHIGDAGKPSVRVTRKQRGRPLDRTRKKKPTQWIAEYKTAMSAVSESG